MLEFARYLTKTAERRFPDEVPHGLVVKTTTVALYKSRFSGIGRQEAQESK